MQTSIPWLDRTEKSPQPDGTAGLRLIGGRARGEQISSAVHPIYVPNPGIASRLRLIQS